MSEAGFESFDLRFGGGKIGTAIVPNRKSKLDRFRWRVWERDNFTCKKCKSRRVLQVDHIYPESKGGKTEMKNLQTLCAKCNRKKGNRT